MPRNAAGVYALPDPPRQPNTVIDSPDENITRDDIATELTNSLDRNGRGGMLAPFRIADGTLAAPGLAFLNEPGTGLWRQAAGVMSLAVQGANIVSFSAPVVNFAVGVSMALGLAVAGDINAASHIVINPTNRLYFDGGIHTFIQEIANDQLRVSAGGVTSALFGPTYVQLLPTHQLFFDGGVDTYIYEVAPDALRVIAGGVASGTFLPSGFGVQSGNRIYVDGSGDTFFVESGPDVLDIIVGGSNSLRCFANGVALQPLDAFYFDGGGDTYIVENSPNILVVTAGGVVAGTFFSLGFALEPTRRLYFDGGGNTFMSEIVADTIRTTVGGAVSADFVPSGVSVGGSVFAPAESLNIRGGNAGIAILNSRNGSSNNWSTIINLGAGSNSQLDFNTGTGLAMRLAADSFCKISNFAGFLVPNGSLHEMTCNIGDFVCVFSNYNAGVPRGVQAYYAATAPNNTQNDFYNGQDVVGAKFRVPSNGGVYNFSANNVNLSDMTVKHYWESYTPEQLEVLSAAVDAMDYGRYKYLDQTHDDWNHGYVAQNVREAFKDAAPELVDEIDWGNRDEKKMLLSVYSTDLVNISLAVARHEIRKLKAEIATLKGLN